MKRIDETLILGIKPPLADFLPEFIQYQELFSAVECDAIIKIGESGKLGNPGVGAGTGETRLDLDYRCVLSRPLDPDEETADLDWVYNRIVSRVSWANAERYRFALSGCNEPIQFLRYDTKKKKKKNAGHYDWHQDYGGGYASIRKLSVVVQLTDGDDYDGCELTFRTHREFTPGLRKRGDTIIFPSWLVHSVTPITRGRRYALVLWVSGPQFT
jgi:PKHD-type hydroxylase